MKISFKYHSAFFLFLFFLSRQNCFPQNTALIDSLQNLLNNAKEDTIKIFFLNEISWEYHRDNPEKSIEIAKDAIKYSQKINFKKGEAKGLNTIGVVNYYQGNYDNALKFYSQSLDIKKQNNDTSGTIATLNNMAIAYQNLGEYETSLKYSEDALNLSEKIKDKQEIARGLNNIGQVNFQLGKFDLSLSAYLKALTINEDLNDKGGIANSLSNIGVIHQARKEYDKALEYFKKCLSINEEINDIEGIAFELTDIGNIHHLKKETDLALEYYFKSLKYMEELNFKEGVASCYGNISGVYNEKKQYQKALEYCQKSLKLYEEMKDKNHLAASYATLAIIYRDIGNFSTALKYYNEAISIQKEISSKEYIADTYQSLSKLYEKQNDFKKAYEFHQLYSQTKDSLLNEESSKQIAEMQTKYETEKKQKEIELLNKDKELQNVELEKKEAEVKKQNTQKIAFGMGFLLVLVLALVIFRGYKQKEKSNLLLKKQKQQIQIKNSHLENANTEIIQQKKEIEEKNHEILASIRYAQRIQQAILPPQKLVKQYLENSFILYKQKDIVAGDFYWMHVSSESGGGSSETKKTFGLELVTGLPTPNSQLILFAACDCTGHGVPGAFVSIVAHNALNRAVKEFGLKQPAKILDKVNELVEETFSRSENQMQDGMDIALVSLEFGVRSSERAILQYSGANNSIYFIRNEELKEIKADKQPIGHFIDRKPFTNNVIELQKGDSIYAFSDGYADQFGGPKGKKFKYSQFEKLLLSIQEKTMTEQRKILNDEIEKWRGELEQIDDICIIGVRI